MNDLLDNQQVRKRRITGSSGKFSSRDQSLGKDSRGKYFHGKSSDGKDSREKLSHDSSRRRAFRPAKVVSLFEQNSRMIDKIKQDPVRNHQQTGTSQRHFDFPQEHSEERKNTKRVKQPREKRFLFSAVPVAALLLLVLGFFFINMNRGDSFDWLDREVVDSGKDQGSQYNLALYAGVSPPAEKVEEAIGTGTNAAIPLDLMDTFAWRSYKVKKGDTVSKIAQDFSVSMDAIIASNGITNARALREGEVLRIPNMDGIPYLVKSGDNLTGISNAMGVPLEAILDANDLQSDRINAGMTLFIPGARMNSDDLKMALGELYRFIYPVRGARLSSPFGWRDDPFGSGARVYHPALDLSVAQGTPIVAAMGGRIAAVGFDRTYGNYVIISHSGEFQTMYAHMHTVSVKRGDQVAQGAQIGTVGSTGRSTGPHVHFALYINGTAVNPLDFMNSSR